MSEFRLANSPFYSSNPFVTVPPAPLTLAIPYLACPATGLKRQVRNCLEEIAALSHQKSRAITDIQLMKTSLVVQVMLALSWCAGVSRSADAPAPTPPLFPDKNLETAVRKFVFDKRDNDKPLIEADVANLSTIQAGGLGITNLAGLEKCQNLASLDLPKNQISDLGPLKGLAKIQYLNLAENQIADTTPLGAISALQYIELSRNRVKDLKPLSALTNLASLYLSHNQIADISPLLKLPKLTSLYLDNNKVTTIAGVNALINLSTLSLNGNAIADLAPLNGLTGLYFLFLENNRIRDLTPLVTMAKNDREQRFAPFLNLYLKGNPLSSTAQRGQTSALKEIGVKVFN